MDIEQLRDYALERGAVDEGFPFAGDTLVFTVNQKMFLLVNLGSHPLRFNVKCDPDKAIEWRERYACVTPGYHMNKKHWNTVAIDGTLDDRQLMEMIDDSYRLVARIK